MRPRSFPLILSLVLIALTPLPAWARFDGGAGPAAHRATVASGSPAKPMPSASAAGRVATTVSPKAAPRVAQATAVEPLTDWVLHLPSNAPHRQPLQVLVAMHGMGGNGPDFAKPLLPTAEAMGWAVLAPTMPYRDFRDPEQVRRDGELLPRLKALVDSMPAQTGLTFRSQVMLFGFSRGSQEAHRFSFMYPELTRAVAGLSAGSYTLPSKIFKQQTTEQVLNYPFGVGDVEAICGRVFNPEAARSVKYWIGVGASDNRNEDVPRQWDRLIGINRVERAQRFVSALQQFGAQASFTAYPSVGHEVTTQMQADALKYLASVSS